jgi:hypothetical protein
LGGPIAPGAIVISNSTHLPSLSPADSMTAKDVPSGIVSAVMGD